VIADCLFVSVEENLSHPGTDDGNLASLFEIQRIQKPALFDGERLDVPDLGVIPHDVEATGLDASGDVVAGAEAAELIARSDDRRLGDLPPNCFGILIVELEGAPWRQPPIGFAGPAGPNIETVGGAVRESGGGSVLKTLARPQENHEHEDAPEDPEGG
jgi:hypothetical protein